MTVIANVAHAPPAPFIPEEWLGKRVVLVLVCWAGDPAEGEKAIAPLRALAEPVAEVVAVMPYPAIFNFTAEAAVPHPNVVRSMFTHEISDATLDHMLAAMESATSPMSIQFRGLGGAMARVGRDETAFALRDMDYQATIIALWQDLSEDMATHEAWAQSLWEKIRVDSAGSYVNFLDEEGEERVRDSYPPATYARLAEIKAKYDPTNLFRLNQNIPPAN
ncbi:MAG TPA: BBE domain-containing protein [Dehalococcoidia bacterium]|nr:BBE domain-containing protein [Dehalococcoidia bacterium]